VEVYKVGAVEEDMAHRLRLRSACAPQKDVWHPNMGKLGV